MISSISLTNYQSHKDSRLALHPGVNAIVGASDSGKTAILRALNWVLTNRPAGDAFRSTWGGETSASIRIEHSDRLPDEVKRVKTDKDNYYQITTLGDRQIMKAMGQGIPETIAKALNMNSVNVQGQMDAPFLLSSSAGEVAQVLNEVVGLEDIDKALTNANRMARQASQDLAKEQEQVEYNRKSLEAYAGLDELDGILTKIESAQAEANRTRTKESELNRILLSVQAVEEELIEVETVAGLWSEYALVQEKDAYAHKLNSDIHSFHVVVNTLAVTDLQLSKVNAVAMLSSELDGILKVDSEGDALFRTVDTLTKAIGAIDKMEEQVADGANLLFNMQQTFTKNFPSECPLCGQEVKK